MSILHRYVLKEHIAPFSLSLSVIIFILIINRILFFANLLLGKGVGLQVIAEFFFLSLAWMIALAIPMSVLVSTLMAFGRLSSDNEITAIRASGVSIYYLMAPVLVAVSLLSVGLVLFNDRILPDFNLRAKNLLYDIRRKKPALELKDMEGIFINDFSGYNVLFEKIDEDASKMYNVTIYQQQEGKYPVSIRAKWGDLKFSEETDNLILSLYDGEIHQLDPEDSDRYVRTTFKRHLINIPDVGQTFKRTSSLGRGDREMSVRMMLDEIKSLQNQKKVHRDNIDTITEQYIRRYLPAWEASSTHSASVDSLVDRFSNGSHDLARDTRKTLIQVRRETANMARKNRKINQYLVEIHKKFSIPTACIVFVLVGVPLGIMAGKRGQAIAVISIGFFALYWAFLRGGEILADREVIPPYLSMWAPNIVIGACGLYLTFRSVKRHALAEHRKQADSSPDPPDRFNKE